MESHKMIKENAPCYIFSVDRYIGNLSAFKSRLNPTVRVCCSVKSNPFLAEYGAASSDCVEVCSFGELKLCAERHISEAKTVVGGIYKSNEELRYLAEHKYARISIESVRELSALNSMLFQTQIKQNVLLRLSSGNQFGMNSEEIIDILNRQEDYPYICFKGIHFYSGTQKKQTKAIDEDLKKIEDTISKCPVGPCELEYGPGIGFPLFSGRDTQWMSDIVEHTVEKVNTLSNQFPVTLEIGRMLCADCGQYVARIVDIKQHGDKRFYIVDAGIHQIHYYGQAQGIPLPSVDYLDRKEGDKEVCTICGVLCTANDIIAKGIELPKGAVGDYLVFDNVGAYSVTESLSLFLSHALPTVVVEDKGVLRMVRKRKETYHLNSEENKS